MEILITSEYIELNKLLKIADIAPTGGVAGIMISNGEVGVDGFVELRKRCKIRPGQTVQFEDIEIKVSSEHDV